MHEIIQTSVMITAFVLLMMLIIEYINIQTKGSWDKPLKQKPWLQVLIAAFLGATPGCLGVYTVVSLFTHRVLSFGALVATMIATSGDEAFFMFALFPVQAFWILILSFVLAIVVGILVDMVYKKGVFLSEHAHEFQIHKHHEISKMSFNPNLIWGNIRRLSFARGFILVALLLFLAKLSIDGGHSHGALSLEAVKQQSEQLKQISSIAQNKEPVLQHQDTGAHIEEHHHDSELESHEAADTESNWTKIIFIVMSLVGIYIVLVSTDHFIQQHAWNHVLKKHSLKIFLWTFGTLLAIWLGQKYVNIEMIQMVHENLWMVLVFAVLLGIIPESGPHMIFVVMFFNGMAPFSILLANSIVQDGHGALPLFAENKRAFVHMKVINIGVGFLIGAIGLWLGF